MTEYTPTTAEVRHLYASMDGSPANYAASEADFDRWLNEVKAEAIRGAARSFAIGEWFDAFTVGRVTDDVSAVNVTVRWFEGRAGQIERGEDV